MPFPIYDANNQPVAAVESVDNLSLTIASPGDFSRFPQLSESDKGMYRTAYVAADLAELWLFLREESTPGEGGFMFSTLPGVQEAANLMCDGFPGHSGASAGFTCRRMQHIARIGWAAYCQEHWAWASSVAAQPLSAALQPIG